MGVRWLTALAALVFLVLSPLASAAGPAPDRATFSYGMGARAGGFIDGTCEGRAIAPAEGRAGELAVGGAWHAVLRQVDRWVNYTEILRETGQPVTHVLETGRSEHAVPLDGRALDIAWGASGRALVLELAGPDGVKRPFDAAFGGTAFRMGAANSENDRAVVWGAAQDPSDSSGSLSGWARPMSLAQPDLAASGDLSIYLEEALVRDGAATYAVPAHQETTQSGGPGLQVVSDHVRYAWLDLRDATLRTQAPDTILYCAGLAAHIQGTLTAFAAAGRVDSRGTSVTFDRREFTLAGSLDLRESFHPVDARGDASAPTEATVEGRFDAVGLDFTAPAGTPGTTWPAAATAAAGGVALVILSVVVLYSRIAEDHVLDRPERRRLYEGILANPGIEFSRLVEQNPMSATNARYHLKLLERRGLVRVVTVQGRHRYVPSNLDANRTRQELLISEDPKVRNLLGLLNADGRPASELVDALRREWGLSRTGGWKVLDRAVRANLVERLVQQRRVIVRRAP
jgi:DNA-binding transcriptional ArsR family regulator